LRKILNFLVLTIVAGSAIVYFTLGPNVFLGGPTKNAIIDITRQVMIATSPSPTEAELAKTAKISPTGVCNPSDGKYACGVEVTVDGAAPKTFVAVLKKGADGNWVMAE